VEPQVNASYNWECIAMRMDRSGIVFNIQRFSLHDGPGIRTTVFKKGCPLKCKWCCNPESMNVTQEILIQDIRCIRCGKCKEVCSNDAITSIEGNKRIDFSKCSSCMECVKVCPTKTLECIGTYLSVDEVVKEAKRDFLFYQNSGGGVTISGGEPLLQWEFTRDILKACKKEGLNTALDTSGYGSWEALEEVLKYVDLILYDVKHTDNDLHLKGTGVSNTLILQNLEKIASQMKTWIRFPVIPGFNDSLKNIKEVAYLASQFKVEKVSLLPYHEFGKSKYEKLGRDYLFQCTNKISEKHLEEIKMVFVEKGIQVTLND
jgi:pyruvate formate lyase activating enzyme